jgi:hypothetical protein
MKKAREERNKREERTKKELIGLDWNTFLEEYNELLKKKRNEVIEKLFFSHKKSDEPGINP